MDVYTLGLLVLMSLQSNVDLIMINGFQVNIISLVNGEALNSYLCSMKIIDGFNDPV